MFASAAWLALAASTLAAAAQINPVPRPVLTTPLSEWTFDEGPEHWVAEHHCVIAVEDGILKIQATDDDPYVHRRLEVPGGQLALHFRARSTNGGSGAIYWMTAQSPRRGEDKARHFALNHDGQWHEYRVPFHAPGTLIDLRIDPGAHAGRFECDWIRLVRQQVHPLVIERIERRDQALRFTVRNDREEPVTFPAFGRSLTVPGRGTVAVDRPLAAKTPLEVVTIELAAGDLPAIRRTVMVHHPEVDTEVIVQRLGPHRLEVARDGTLARVRRPDGQLVAVLGPLVHHDGQIPALRLVDESPVVRFEGPGTTVSLEVHGTEIQVEIRSEVPCEGPVVRAMGRLEQGLLAGLEFLGRGEASSSTLDVETEEHLRFAPDPLKVTMPLAAFVTDLASVALSWADMGLQPTYATPNFFDAAGDHRMALRGKEIQATVRLSEEPLEELIAWAVRRRGLPPVPPAPRTPEEQAQLCLAALEGPLKTDEGWGHCVEDRWPRRWHADMASTIWRLTGQVPDMPRLVPGGGHIRNDTIYFVTGQVAQWLQIRRQQVRQLLGRQRPDGSFRYAGKYARGHFEDTASGVCARPAASLLQFAWITGDAEALAAGIKTLEYMKRFRTPRGAQVWEIPLHTPDLLASAYAVWAYVRGYQLTQDPDYLRQARKWALTGVPFVYLWGRYPVMVYGTPPVYGATNWRAPAWFGLPVQWVGVVYAYALTLLAPYDDTLDWNHLARGILVAGQQMQYPDGPYVGLLPDAFQLAGQERRPWRINPTSMVSLQLAVDGQVDFLAVATDGKHRVAAPFPVTIRDGTAEIEGREGVSYQVLIDGQRIVDVHSQGRDLLPCGPP